MNLFVVIVLGIISIMFLLVGSLIVFRTKNNKSIMTFSVSLGFIVLVLLGFIHLLPDAYIFFLSKFSKINSIIYIILIALLGFFVVFIIDRFTGHNEEKNHIKHISIITCIFLVIHNFIEGMTLYSTVLLSYESAVLLTLGIGLHNIPLGFTLSSTYSKSHTRIETVLYMIFIGFSYLLGALVSYKFTNIFISEVVLGILLMITFGMIMYIAIFEFLPEIIESKDVKMKAFGIIIGIILMTISLLL